MTATEFVWLVIGVLAGMIAEHIRADLGGHQGAAEGTKKPPA